MNNRAESVKFVTITTLALIMIGFMFVVLVKNPTVSAKTTYNEKQCYDVYNGRLVPADVSKCCLEIKESAGCKPYEKDLFICGSVAVDKNTIESCS